MSKAIAVQAIFLIGVIAISLLFIVGIFSQWTSITKSTVNEATCKANFIGCCSALTSGTKKSCEWNDECSQYNIQNPNPNWQDVCCKGELKGPKCPK